MSDEEEEPGVGESSDEYVVDSETDDSSEYSDCDVRNKMHASKRRKTVPTKQRQSMNVSDIDSISNVTRTRKPIASTSADTPDEDTQAQTIEQVVRAFTVDSDSSDEDNTCDDQGWNNVTGEHLKNFPFVVANAGISPHLYENYIDKNPIDFYELFINEDIISMMVSETNRYAYQCKAKESAPKARIHRWQDTDIPEMKKFIGILLWMGLCQYPSIESYWSTCVLYHNKVKNVMSRNRFQLILKMWHFHNNDVITNERLQKISPLMTKLKEAFQSVIIPKESVCIDESIVPFRGRLSFKQYIKNKRHKFGIKLYKLCLEKGYTYNFAVYSGQDKVEGQSSSANVVFNLSNNLLNEGRTIYTDNYYTSVDLAQKLLEKKTHLVGTLRSNRKRNPKRVIEKKLKKGETVAAEHNSGIVVQKWKDKREVLTLSTKHTSEMGKIKCGNKESTKPNAIIDYNKHKAYIDLSDQMKAYNNCLRRGVKWYRKLAVEFITGTALVNAHFLYQEVTQCKMNITKFREGITMKLLDLENPSQENPNEGIQHVLIDAGRTNRGRCVVCYDRLQKEFGRKHAQYKAPKSKLKCEQCDKHYCMPCFFVTHNCTKQC